MSKTILFYQTDTINPFHWKLLQELFKGVMKKNKKCSRAWSFESRAIEKLKYLSSDMLSFGKQCYRQIMWKFRKMEQMLIQRLYSPSTWEISSSVETTSSSSSTSLCATIRILKILNVEIGNINVHSKSEKL